MAKKRTERFVGTYRVPGRFSLWFRVFLKRRFPWAESLRRRKDKKKTSPPFEGSSIVAKPFPDQKRSRVGIGPRKTKSGKLYAYEYAHLKHDLERQGLSKQRVSTIMAFCKNYYIEKNELPSMDDLKKIFGF